MTHVPSTAAVTADDERSQSPAVAIELCAEILRSRRPVTLTNLSNSLWPLVRNGDALTLQPASDARLGQLAGVLRAGRLVVHRVVRVRGARLWLKGDANEQVDPEIDRAEIVGVVATQRLPWGPVVSHGWLGMRALNVVVAVVSRTWSWPWRWLRRLNRLRRHQP